MRELADRDELPSLYLKIALVSKFAAMRVRYERESSDIEQFQPWYSLTR